MHLQLCKYIFLPMTCCESQSQGQKLLPFDSLAQLQRQLETRWLLLCLLQQLLLALLLGVLLLLQELLLLLQLLLALLTLTDLLLVEVLHAQPLRL